EDEGGRREVVVRDPAGEREGEGRQERPVGADAPGNRLGDDPLGRRGTAKDDAERLATPELDEDRLAGLEIRERWRNRVGVAARATPAGSVDRDLDVADGLAGCAVPGIGLQLED